MKATNKLSVYKNRLKFSLYGINYGRNMVIHGSVGLRLAHKACISIGNNFYYSSGKNLNPLCAEDRGYLCCNQGATLEIGDNVGASSSRIWAHRHIKIGNNVLLGGGTIIIDSDAHSLDWQARRNIATDLKSKKDAPIVIEDDVMIGMNCLILKGVTIGARSVIGAGSVVTQSIPADCIAAGNPARVIKCLKNNRK